MTIEPCSGGGVCFVFVKTQVTVSPGSRSIAEGSLSSSQVASVRSQPGVAPSATEYVPGSSGSDSFVWPSESENGSL